MSSVDNRVVELKFDNRQFEAATAQSMATLDKLKKSMDFSGSTKSLDALGSSTKRFDMGNLGGMVEGVSAKFLALGTIGVTALANITTKAIQAGEQVTKALTVDPIHSGFQEYELKMGAIQTIMAGSGASLKTVNKYLDELNTYSDKTIYSFSDMTQNIGKFTNAGVKLKDAVGAIQGIANVAAVSGANADEAGRAMYNFSQALSKGSVALIDWKSIEMANMGTVEFKTQLLDAAAAQGTLTKKGDEYKTKKGKMISATKGFNDSLQEEWLTTKVLTKTLGDYADSSTKIGKKSFAAAQDVKTLSQMYDTLKEAAGSGWAQTFELLFGNLTQAKGRWTALNNVIGGWIQANADSRNAEIKHWKVIGGLTKAHDLLRESLRMVKSYLKPLKAAWQSVFPPAAAEHVLAITEALRKFVHMITLDPKQMKELQRALTGLFSILDIGKQVLSGVFHFLVDFFHLITDGTGVAGLGILSFVARIGDMITTFDKFLKTSNAIPAFFDKLLVKLVPLSQFLGRIGTNISEFISGLGDKLPTLFKKSGDSAGEANDKMSPLEKTILAIKDAWKALVDFVQGTVSFLGSVVSAFTDAWKNTGDASGGFVQHISEAFSKVNWVTIFKTALATGFLAGLALAVKGVYSFINTFFVKPGKILDSIKKIFESVNDVVKEFKNTLKAYQQELKAKALMEIAAAILMLAVALKIIAGIDTGNLAKATVTVGALFAMLALTVKSIGKIGTTKDFQSIPKVALGILLIGGAMLVLAVALKIIGSIDFGKLVKGVTTFGLVMVVLVRSMESLGKIKGKVLSASAAILILSFAMIALAAAIWLYSKMDVGTLLKGSLMIAAALAIIGLAMRALPPKGQMMKAAASIVIIAIALKLLMGPIKTLGEMKLGSLITALLALTVMLALVVVALVALSDPVVLAGAAAMILAAQSIKILAQSLQIIGDMSIAQIITSVLALVVAFAAIAAATFLLAPAIPFIALFGAALLILGAGVALFGIGALAFASAFSIAVGIASLGIPVLKDAINNLIGVMPQFGELLYQALTTFAVAITKAIPVIVKVVVTLVSEILKAIEKLIPQALHTLGKLLDAFLAFIVRYIPKIADAGLKIILGLLTAIDKNLPKIITKGTSIITNLITGIGKSALAIATAAGDTLISFMVGLTNWINANQDKLNAAGHDLVEAIITGMISGVGALGGGAVDAIEGLAGNMVDGVKGIFKSSSPSKVFIKIGKDVVAGLVIGIVGDKAHVRDALRAITEEVKKAKDDVADHIADLNSKIKDLKGIKKRTPAQNKALAKDQAELKEALRRQKQLDAAYKDITKDRKKQEKALEDLGTKYDKTKKKLDKAKQAYADAVKERADFQKSITDKYNTLPTLVDPSVLTKSQEDLNKAQADYNDLVAKGTASSEELANSLDAVTQAQDAVKQATYDASLDAYFDQIRKTTQANITFKKTLDQLRDLGLDDESYKKFLEQGTSAQPFLDQLLAAGKGTIKELNSIDSSLTSSATSLGKTAASELYDAGVNSAKGIVDGLESQMTKITTSMKKIGKVIADEIKKELGIKSPSKVFADIGKDTVLGLAKGLTENNKVIEISAKKLGTTAADSLRQTMTDLSDVIGNEVNLEPVIAPVLDLDQFRKDAAAVTGILTPNGISPVTSTATAVGISSAAMAQKAASEHELAATGTTFEYTQINQSPKALSTAEIYRQTKNQLSTVKGALR